MKKNHFALVYFMLIHLNVSFSQNLSIKFYGGGNFYHSIGSQILSNGEEKQLNIDNGKYGYFVGYGIDYEWSNKLFFNAGIEFSQRNEDKGLWETLKNPHRYHYLSFSPSFGYEVKNFRPKIGFQLDYLLHKQKISYFDFVNKVGNFSNYDAGFTFGLAYRIYQFEFFGSYCYGLPYIVSLEGGRVENHDFSEFTKSRMFKFGVGYFIN